MWLVQRSLQTPSSHDFNRWVQLRTEALERCPTADRMEPPKHRDYYIRRRDGHVVNWERSPVKEHRRVGCKVCVGITGLVEPTMQMKSICRRCGRQFGHAELQVLEKLPVACKQAFEVDPPFMSDNAEIVLMRSLTDIMTIDITMRQSFADVAEKLAMQCVVDHTRRSQAYFEDLHVWWPELRHIVGDAAWASRIDNEQFALVDERAEYKYWDEQEESSDAFNGNPNVS